MGLVVNLRMWFIFMSNKRIQVKVDINRLDKLSIWY